MKRKLLLVNLGLAAVLLAGAIELHRRIEQARERYTILQNGGAPEEQEPAVFPAPQPPPRLRQADYLPVVDRLLLSQDRNAVVEVEAPAETVVQRPALPVLMGVMNLGKGPIALMAENSESMARPIELGGKVGEYTFVGVSGEKLKLAWQGEEIEVAQSELTTELKPMPRGARPAAGGPGGTARRPTANRGRPTAQRPAASPAVPTPDTRKAIGGRYNIGTEIRPGAFRADPRDTSPEGTEFEGYRKVVRATPFGTQSWWERKDMPQQ
jgi:hypothetical protein